MAIINHNSISGINTISVGSSIVIGDNFVLNTNGIENVNGLNISGVVTASSFVGDGSSLTGIDATALKDPDGNVIIQAEASGINVTGVSTFSDEVYFGASAKATSSGGNFTLEGNIGNSAGTYLRGSTVYIGANGGSGSYSNTVVVREASGNQLVELAYAGSTKLATTAGGIDVTGHAELDNINISGVLTATSAEFSGNVTVLGDLTYENVTNLDSVGVATARSGLRITDGGLDVVGVATFNSNIEVTSTYPKIILKDSDSTGNQARGHISFVDSGGNLKWFIGDAYGTNSYLEINGNDNGIIFGAGGTLRSYINSDGHFIPYLNNSYDLGYFSTKWRNLWMEGTLNSGQLNITGVSTFSGNVSVGSSILLGDFNRILFGDDDDMSMYFDGTRLKITPKDPATTVSQLDFEAKDQVYIESKTNGIFLRGNNQSIIDMYGGSGGGIYFHHNGNDKLKLEGGNWTTQGNADWTFTGTNYNAIWDASADSLRFNDNAKAVFGTGDDLLIYHDGSNSYIKDNGTGSLIIRAQTGTYIQSNSNGTDLAAFIDNAGAYLYYAGSQKLVTTSTGIDVTGNVTCDNNVTIQSSSGYGNIEIGGTSGAYIDMKNPMSDDFDFRLLTSGTGGEINVNGNNLTLLGHFVPHANNTYDLGTSSVRWRNVYSADLQLSNEGSANDVDGTWGNYTIQEGEEDLFLINRRSGKKYAFVLREVD